MKNLRNSVQLIGRLGSDPEVRTLTNGNKVVNLSIAVDDSYKNKSGEKVERTYWHDLVAWGKVGEIIAEYMAKGEEHMFQGKLTKRDYETSDGQKRYVTGVVVDEVLLLNQKEKNPMQPSQATTPVSTVPKDDSDELPF